MLRNSNVLGIIQRNTLTPLSERIYGSIAQRNERKIAHGKPPEDSGRGNTAVYIVVGLAAPRSPSASPRFTRFCSCGRFMATNSSRCWQARRRRFCG